MNLWRAEEGLFIDRVSTRINVIETRLGSVHKVSCVFSGFLTPFSHISAVSSLSFARFWPIFLPPFHSRHHLWTVPYHFFINVIETRLSFYWKTYFLYSPSTVVFEYFSTSFMALTRSLMSLDSTLWAISTWK